LTTLKNKEIVTKQPIHQLIEQVINESNHPKSSMTTCTTTPTGNTTNDVSLFPVFRTKLESFIQDTLHKIQAKDNAMTKLILDDFGFSHHHDVVVENNDWNYDDEEEDENAVDSRLDEPTMIRLMEAATASILSQVRDGIPSPLQQLEFLFVTLSSSPDFLSALQKLIQAKLKIGTCWKSISWVGCYSTPQSWNKVFLNDRSNSGSIVYACEELVLNHNSLPLEAYQSLGDAMRNAATSTTVATTTANMICLHIQRETITEDKAKALFGRTATTTSVHSPTHLKVPELILNFCRLDGPAVQTLSRQYLRYNDQLQILNLGACYLSDRQVFTIVNALCNHKPALHTLILTLNHCHTQGSLALQELLSSSHCRLRHLNISHQKLQRCKLLHMAALAQGVASCPTLQELNLSRNQLTAHDIHTFMECLKDESSSSSLQSLDVSSNPLGRPGLANIVTSLPTLRCLKRLFLMNTVPQYNRKTNDDKDNNDVYDRVPELWSREVQQAMENLPLALIQGLQHNTSVEYVDICRMEWLSPAMTTTTTSSKSLSKRSYGNRVDDNHNSIPDCIICRRSEEQLLDLIRYYTALNIGGRKLLSLTTSITCSAQVPLGLWPVVLERAQKSCRSFNHHLAKPTAASLVPDVLFHLLQQGPVLTHQRKNELVVDNDDNEDEAVMMRWNEPSMYIG
jgi:hypothetical protein